MNTRQAAVLATSSKQPSLHDEPEMYTLVRAIHRTIMECDWETDKVYDFVEMLHVPRDIPELTDDADGW